MSDKEIENQPTCPARIVTRVYSESGDDTYTDEITVCGGELVIWRQEGGFVNAWGEGDTFTTGWDVRCLEDQHVVLTPYDDTNGPTVPCPDTEAEAAHWIWKAVGLPPSEQTPERCESREQSMRCILEAGHDGSHKAGTTRWRKSFRA